MCACLYIVCTVYNWWTATASKHGRERHRGGLDTVNRQALLPTSSRYPCVTSILRRRSQTSPHLIDTLSSIPLLLPSLYLLLVPAPYL